MYSHTFLFAGVIHPTSFSKLSSLQTIYISKSQLSSLYFDSFSTCSNLRIIQFNNSRINVAMSTSSRSFRLQYFSQLSFQATVVSGLTRNAFYGLRSLTKLEFEFSEITSISFDAFYDLERITYLSIKSCTILDFDFKQILRLKSLKYLALTNIRTNSVINYNQFGNLPNLETIVFDLQVFDSLDIDRFPKLKNCKIGVDEDVDVNNNPLLNKIQKKLKLKTGILSSIFKFGKGIFGFLG